MGSKFGVLWALAALAVVAGFAGCSDPGGNSGGGCVTGSSCDCPSGSASPTGIQACNPDGIRYGACNGCAPVTSGVCSAAAPTGSCPSGQVCASGTCIAIPPAQCSAANPSGACPSGQTCTGGACVMPTSPCSPANPAGACATGQTCVAGACCTTDNACGAVCCNAGSVCIADAAGNRSCAQRCTASSQCPASANCCRVLADATTRQPLPYGACGAFVAGQTSCMCASATECGSGAGCTPVVGSDGIPQRPYRCTTDSCTPYGHCTGITGSCPNGYCNLCDAQGRCYCAAVCTSAAMCGAATCGPFSRSNGSCSASQTACQPR